MKKILALIITFLTVFVFVSCTSGGGSSSSTEDPLDLDQILENLEDAGLSSNDMTDNANDNLDELNEELEAQGIGAISGKIASMYMLSDSKTYESVVVIELESTSDAKKIEQYYENLPGYCERDGKLVIYSSSEELIDKALGKSSSNNGDDEQTSTGDDETATGGDTSTSTTPTYLTISTIRTNLSNAQYQFDGEMEDLMIELYGQAFDNMLKSEGLDPLSGDIKNAIYAVVDNTYDANYVMVFEFEKLADAKNVFNYFTLDDEDNNTYAQRVNKIVIVASNDSGCMFATGGESPVGADVFFDINGGYGDVPGPIYVSYGEAFQFSDIDAKKDGCTFAGWSKTTTPEEGKYYAPGDSYTVYENGSVTFYAVWLENTEAAQATIIFNSNDGKDQTTELTLQNGAILTMPDTYFERYGYKFVGWSKDSVATKAEYLVGESFYNSPFEETVTFYAIWEKTDAPVIDIEGLYERDGDTIYFGNYPQTQVTDSYITEALNDKAGELPSSSNSYNWTSYGYYANGYSQNYMWYIDLEYEGEYYRGVYFTSYRPHDAVDYADSYNSDQDESGYYTYTAYWFKYEPIKWTILSDNGDSAFIVSELVIDSQAYDNDGNGGWSESSVRAWLNDTFYETAFNELQKKIIIETSVDNSSSSYDTSTTLDYIFLLSNTEAENNNLVYGDCVATDYAFSQGNLVGDITGYAEYWYLRTAGNSTGANTVINDSIGETGTPSFTRGGTRPALNIMLSGEIEGDQDTPSIEIDGLYERDGDTIYFGNYPQTLVSDDYITEALDEKAGTLPTLHDSYNWTSYGYISSNMVVDYMWYIDLEYEGEYYRGVYFIQYRPWHLSSFAYDSNSNLDNNGYYTYTTYWFKYEPIEWTVIAEEDGIAALICNMVIDSQDYDHNGELVYSSSTIRVWLDNEFKNTAFNESQQQILSTLYGEYDYVTLISAEEALSLGISLSRSATDYAYAQGFANTSHWWLRQDDGEQAAVYGGTITYSYGTTAYSAWGVVPMVFIELSTEGEGTDDPTDTDAQFPQYTYPNKDIVDLGIDTYERTGNTVKFGYYPQSEVTDSYTLEQLNWLGEDAEWTVYPYYSNSELCDCMSYTDVIYNGDMYRGVYIYNYRSEYTDTNQTKNQQYNGYYTGYTYWFKYEPISWTVVDEIDGKALIVSDLIIDAQEYQSLADGTTEYNSNNYEQSTVRAWLNEVFYKTAFSTQQMSYINTTLVDNSINQSYFGYYSSNDTEDKIFLLSFAELIEYQYSMNMSKQVSDYAAAQGAFKRDDDCGCWATRTPYSETYSIHEVFYDGGFGDTISSSTDWASLGVVPALWITIE
ncbi:MAG: InlB B-repeat-containing protein [Clostridia bacterium]|nr:InlB B-repeat-containing protein [Clostridia bacterium]